MSWEKTYAIRMRGGCGSFISPSETSRMGRLPIKVNSSRALPVFGDEEQHTRSPVNTDDEAAFAGLMERQWRFACKVAWAVLRNAADAEDAAQEVFLKLLRAGGWRDLRDERAFVARAAWRAAVDRLRQRGAVALDEEIPGAEPGPEAAVVAADWEQAVRGLIESLPEELRQPLVLSAEMTSREVAAVMGVPEGTVRRRLMRARQLMRGKMTALEERRYARG